MTTRTPKFTSPLVVAIVPDDERPVRLKEPLTFVTAWNYIIEVPIGFQSDLASIPRIARPFWSRLDGETAAAAVLHDYLYATHMTSRLQADNIFYEALNASGVRAFKRTVMWLAVRTFGGQFWLS